jgi:hypothetical protein
MIVVGLLLGFLLSLFVARRPRPWRDDSPI